MGRREREATELRWRRQRRRDGAITRSPLRVDSDADEEGRPLAAVDRVRTEAWSPPPHDVCRRTNYAFEWTTYVYRRRKPSPTTKLAIHTQLRDYATITSGNFGDRTAWQMYKQLTAVEMSSNTHGRPNRWWTMALLPKKRCFVEPTLKSSFTRWLHS